MEYSGICHDPLLTPTPTPPNLVAHEPYSSAQPHRSFKLALQFNIRSTWPSSSSQYRPVHHRFLFSLPLSLFFFATIEPWVTWLFHSRPPTSYREKYHFISFMAISPSPKKARGFPGGWGNAHGWSLFYGDLPSYWYIFLAPHVTRLDELWRCVRIWNPDTSLPGLLLLSWAHGITIYFWYLLRLLEGGNIAT